MQSRVESSNLKSIRENKFESGSSFISAISEWMFYNPWWQFLSLEVRSWSRGSAQAAWAISSFFCHRWRNLSLLIRTKLKWQTGHSSVMSSGLLLCWIMRNTRPPDTKSLSGYLGTLPKSSRDPEFPQRWENDSFYLTCVVQTWSENLFWAFSE